MTPGTHDDRPGPRGGHAPDAPADRPARPGHGSGPHRHAPGGHGHGGHAQSAPGHGAHGHDHGGHMHGHDHDHGHGLGHGHGHGHGHGGHGHGHGGPGHGHVHAPSADADRRWLGVALAVIVAFMGVEVVGGIVASSLALLSDAAHMLTDAGAIALALVAARLAARPARGAFTFGLGRAEILSAQINGAALLVLAGLIALEAVQRIADPPEVEGGIVIVVGAIGGLANVGAAWALSRAERQSLNVAGAMAHVLADLYGSVAAVVAGALILATGVGELDGIAALTVSALMVVSGWRLVRDASRVLLEASPAGIDPDEIGRTMAAQAGVVEVHDLHVWEVTTGFPAVAAHVVVAPNDDCHAVRRQLQALLATTFGIRHTTLQVDHPIASQGLLTIEDVRAKDRPE